MGWGGRLFFAGGGDGEFAAIDLSALSDEQGLEICAGKNAGCERLCGVRAEQDAAGASCWIKYLDSGRAGHVPAAVGVDGHAVAASCGDSGWTFVEFEFTGGIDELSQRHDGHAAIETAVAVYSEHPRGCSAIF